MLVGSELPVASEDSKGKLTVLEPTKVSAVSAVPASLELAPKLDENIDLASWVLEFDMRKSDRILEDKKFPEELATGLAVEVDDEAYKSLELGFHEEPVLASL